MNIRIYKKQHKIKLSSITNKTSNTIKYGFYGIKSVVSGILTAKQIEVSRRVVSKKINRMGKIFIRVFFNLAKTKKPLLSRMGKGCGSIKS
jgi:large subunit ribosomal protein L16